MAESLESRDSENNWVIPSAESFPVETVGATQDGAEEATAAGFEPVTPPASEEAAPPPDGKLSREIGEGPANQELPVTEEPKKLDEEQEPPPMVESPKGPSTAGGDLEEVSCSSSDDDVEGLRKRVGRAAPPVSAGPSVREAAQQDADAGLSLNLNTLIIAAFGLICIGLLVFSGGGFSSDDDTPQTVVSRSMKDGEKQPPQVISDIQEWIELHADQFTGDPSSLQVMSGLLDKVAKENQEIRHMQANLQAQKEELEALLSTSEGRNVTPRPQHPGLTEENVRLKDALLKEETAHLSAKEELQSLQEKLEVLETSSLEKEALVVENAQVKVDLDALRRQIEGFLTQKETLVAESQMLRQELDKQRLLVASMRQDLENLVTKSTEEEDEKLLQERLSEMSSRLAMEAQRSETWEKKYVEHAQRRKEQVGEDKRDHGPKEWKKSGKLYDHSTPGGDFRKPHYKHGKRWTEESHRESQHEEWRSKKHDDKHWQDKKHRHWQEEKAGVEIQEERETWKSKDKEHRSKDSVHHRHDHPERQTGHHRGEDREGFHPRKGQKDFTDSHKRREDSERGKEHRHHDHNKFWKKLSDHQYRVPEGCSGLEDCARKDGMDLFNMELKPVQRKQFEEVLLNYLTKSHLSEHLPELTPLLDGSFEGPLFSHHKIRFKDFVDDMEDFLEDVARKEMGNDDIVDDFERYVYISLFGEAATKKRFAKKDEQQKTKKYYKYSGKLEKTYDQGLNQSDDRHPVANKLFRSDHHGDSSDFRPIKKQKTYEKHKPWSPNPQYKEESNYKYKNEDKHNPKTNQRSPKHSDHDENGGSFHYHSHHSDKKPKYPHTKPGREAGGHHHNKEEREEWQRRHHDQHNYDPENRGHHKEQKFPDKRFGKDPDKYKERNPDKYKEGVEHKPYLKKHEKDAENKRYQSYQRHGSLHRDDWAADHKPWRDGDRGHTQPEFFHDNDQRPTQVYPPKTYYHKHEEDKATHRDFHQKHEDKHGNYHQKHGKDKPNNYPQKYEEAKDRDRNDHHKFDKAYHQHNVNRDADYPHKHNKDHHKHEHDWDGDYHHKHREDKNKHGNYGYKHNEERRPKDHHHKYDDHHNPPRKY
ncbi:pre-B-cell leukemia transcription factor-interacting protein 1 isoform X2 [Eleutherodactylus coqui]|uniref:pre-B-cell leukemia transcription factor-interacting protein 1 isoform X2 n=1 Tax=Eleutherodactylus coqui TaxID=57060 RepID=UPI003461C20B